MVLGCGFQNWSGFIGVPEPCIEKFEAMQILGGTRQIHASVTPAQPPTFFHTFIASLTSDHS